MHKNLLKILLLGTIITGISTNVLSQVHITVGNDVGFDLVEGTGKAIASGTGAVVDGTKAAGEAAVDGTVAVGQATWGGLKTVGGWAADGYRAVSDGAIAVTDAIKDGVISDATKAAGEAAVDGTVAAGQATWSGLKTVGGWAADGYRAVSDGAIKMTDAFKGGTENAGTWNVVDHNSYVGGVGGEKIGYGIKTDYSQFSGTDYSFDPSFTSGSTPVSTSTPTISAGSEIATTSEIFGPNVVYDDSGKIGDIVSYGGSNWKYSGEGVWDKIPGSVAPGEAGVSSVAGSSVVTGGAGAVSLSGGSPALSYVNGSTTYTSVTAGTEITLPDGSSYTVLETDTAVRGVSGGKDLLRIDHANGDMTAINMHNGDMYHATKIDGMTTESYVNGSGQEISKSDFMSRMDAGQSSSAPSTPSNPSTSDVGASGSNVNASAEGGAGAGTGAGDAGAGAEGSAGTDNSAFNASDVYGENSPEVIGYDKTLANYQATAEFMANLPARAAELADKLFDSAVETVKNQLGGDLSTMGPIQYQEMVQHALEEQIADQLTEEAAKKYGEKFAEQQAENIQKQAKEAAAKKVAEALAIKVLTQNVIQYALVITEAVLANDIGDATKEVTVKGAEPMQDSQGSQGGGASTTPASTAMAGTTIAGSANALINLLNMGKIDLSLLSTDFEKAEPKKKTRTTEALVGESGADVHATEQKSSGTQKADDLTSEQEREIKRRRALLLGEWATAATQIGEGSNAISSDFLDRAKAFELAANAAQGSLGGITAIADTDRFVLFEITRGAALSAVELGLQGATNLNILEEAVSDDSDDDSKSDETRS